MGFIYTFMCMDITINQYDHIPSGFKGAFLEEKNETYEKNTCKINARNVHK